MPRTIRTTLVTAALVGFVELGCSFGRFTNMAVGADGLGLISYNDGPKALLKVAHCKNAACTSATLKVVDSGNDGPNAMAIGKDHLALISYGAYLEPGREVLRVAHCENVSCSHARVSTIGHPDANSRGAVYFIAMAIGKDGRGLITYCDFGGWLFAAHCEDTACTRATVSLIDSDGGTPRDGGSPSIAIGRDGRGLIAYGNSDRGLLQVEHCNDAACKSATRHTIDSGLGPGVDVGAFPAIRIGADGLGLIAYADDDGGGNLRVAHCADRACTRADVITTLGMQGPGGGDGFISLTIGSDGLGLISFTGRQQLAGALGVAHCQDVKCQSVVASTLDPGSGNFTSVAVGRDGSGLISYQDGGSPGALKVAHCRDVPCTSATLSTLDTGSP